MANIRLDAPFGNGMGNSSGMDWGQIGTGAGGIASGLMGLFGGGQNPYEAANPYLSQISSGSSYLKPYVQAGKSMLNPLSQQLTKIIQNPSDLYSQFEQGFEASPGYQFNVDQATKAANNAAAAGGMVGSPAHQQELAKTVMGLANQDRYSYLENLINMLNGGISGGLNLAGMGQGAGNSIANLLARQAEAQANSAFGGSNYNNQQGLGGIGNILGGIANLIPGLGF